MGGITWKDLWWKIGGAVLQNNNKGILGGHHAKQSMAMAEKEHHHKVQQLSTERWDVHLSLIGPLLVSRWLLSV